MKLAQRIRKIRERKGMTQAEVAFKIDISPSAYGQIERRAGNTRFDTLCKIADALSVKVTFLVDLDNPHYEERDDAWTLSEQYIKSL